jgi:hypothetical protein
MALYRYVESREDLLAGVADLLFQDAQPPDLAGHDWRDQLCEAFAKIRNALVDQPGAALLLPHVGLGDPGHPTAEALTAQLRRAGLSPVAASSLYLDLVRYTLGCVALDHAASPGTARVTPASFESGLRRLIA